MYFKLELQPVNHGDYALPCCALSGSGGIPIPVPQLSTAPAGYCISRDQERQHQPCCWPWAVNTFPEPFQPSRACSPALEGSQPMSSPSWVVSSFWLKSFHAHVHMQTHPRPLQSLNSRGQSIPRGSFPPKTCAGSLWEHQPLGLVLLLDMIFKIIVFNYPNSIIVFHTKVYFSLQPDCDLVLN